MHLRTRLSLGSLFAASAVLATILAWHARSARSTCAPTSSPPITSPQPQQLPEPEVVRASGEPERLRIDGNEGEDEAPGPDTPSATIDKLDLGWFPAEYVRDIGHAKTAALAQLVEDWAVSHSDEPRIQYRKGVVFARSAEDRGDDGPYPLSAQPQGTRVCGEASIWLRDSLRQRLATTQLTCDKNICSYGGSEYAPDGFLVFREINIEGEHQWVLDAWVEVYQATLGTEAIAHNQADVVRALRRERTTSCAGEPAGAY